MSLHRVQSLSSEAVRKIVPLKETDPLNSKALARSGPFSGNGCELVGVMTFRTWRQVTPFFLGKNGSTVGLLPLLNDVGQVPPAALYVAGKRMRQATLPSSPAGPPDARRSRATCR